MSGIIKLTFNPFQENTYIVYNAKKDCWIIDPGNSNDAENDKLSAVIQEYGLNVVECVLTHAHIDHIMGCKYVFETYGVKPKCHRDEVQVFDQGPTASAIWSIPYTAGPKPEEFIKAGSTLKLGELEFEVIFTPGHSPGEISLLNRKDKYCIAGDVLFYGSIGRTDLPGGNYDTLISSIKGKLLVLDDDIVVYSGHGPDTSIGNERRSNPFLQ